jgi:LAO/AO transport system kinase
MTSALSEHAQRVLAGDVRASARLMRWVDDNRPEAHALLAELFPHTGKARIIGLTGNPGAGKSTLVNALIHHLRRAGKTVGCVAVDPTSPFSGGAILGDRVRMQQHALDRGVFIRSVATRGNLGGISRSTPAIVQILDAMGFDVILIETVGVGQDEVDIVRLADTSVVLQVPGLGDDIQASKAGILEIADILVINKADNPAAKRLRRELTAMLELDEDRSPDRWQIPVIDTVASEDQGIDKLLEGIMAHLEWLDRTGKRAEIERARQAHYIHLIALGQLEARLRAAMGAPAWGAVLDGVCARSTTPEAAASALLAELQRGCSPK